MEPLDGLSVVKQSEVMISIQLSAIKIEPLQNHT